jgi:hypothetical protein
MNREEKQQQQYNNIKQRAAKQGSQRQIIRQQNFINSLNSPPPAGLLSNRNGLPFKTQTAILANVCRFRGLDDFARDTCDKNPELFGVRNSRLRKACQDKRRHFVETFRNDPDKFVQLCAEFDTLADGVHKNKNQPTATTSSLLAFRKPGKATNSSSSSSDSSDSSLLQISQQQQELSEDSDSENTSSNQSIQKAGVTLTKNKLASVCTSTTINKTQIEQTKKAGIMTSTRKAIKNTAGKF